MADVTKNYKPDRSVRDERPAFDSLAAPLFFRGGDTGCIVLHGIGGTPANVRVVADRLIAAGCTVNAPLLPGHGETVRAQNSATAGQWLSCVEASYDRLLEAGCTQIFAIGLSLGGILSGVLATIRPLAGLGLVCAPVIMQPFLDNVRRVSPFVPYVRYCGPQDADPQAQMYQGFATGKLRDLNRLRKRLIRSMGDIRCPILVLQAAHDNKVDPRSIDVIRAHAVHAPSIDYHLLPNSPHGCTYGPERDLAASLCAAFVQNTVDRGAPKPI